jgi:hypothetical protein
MIALFLFFPRDFGEIFGTHFFKNMTREEEAERNANNMRVVVYLSALSRAKTNERTKKKRVVLFCLLSAALTCVSLSLCAFKTRACVRTLSFFCCVLNFLCFRVLNPKT